MSLCIRGQFYFSRVHTTFSNFVFTQSDSSKIRLIVIHLLDHVLHRDNLIQLIELGIQPISIDVERLDKGSGILPTLIQEMQNGTKRAKNKFSNMKLQWMEAQKSQ